MTNDTNAPETLPSFSERSQRIRTKISRAEMAEDRRERCESEGTIRVPVQKPGFLSAVEVYHDAIGAPEVVHVCGSMFGAQLVFGAQGTREDSGLSEALELRSAIFDDEPSEAEMADDDYEEGIRWTSSGPRLVDHYEWIRTFGSYAEALEWLRSTH